MTIRPISDRLIKIVIIVNMRFTYAKKLCRNILHQYVIVVSISLLAEQISKRMVLQKYIPGVVRYPLDRV